MVTYLVKLSKDLQKGPLLYLPFFAEKCIVFAYIWSTLIFISQIELLFSYDIINDTNYSDVASGRAGWALAHPEFESSVNPITTRGADYAHHITASPPGIENPAASLICTFLRKTCQSLVEWFVLSSINPKFEIIFLRDLPEFPCCEPVIVQNPGFKYPQDFKY